MKDIVFGPEARLELEEAYKWYEDKRAGLGKELLLVVDAAIEQIRRSPEIGTIVHRNVRRILTRRFPYGIFYIVEERRIYVVAVFHGSRNPLVVLNRD
jgi:plasmid stabilization system protein ParE